MSAPLPEDPFERVEVATQNLARRVVWEQGNRIGLLRVHAVVGVLAGAQMLAFGGPTQLEALFGPPVRIILGTIGLVGGAILFSGLETTPRSIYREALGLTVLGLWDLVMTLGLAWARLHSTSFGLNWPSVPEPSPATGYVAPYPIAVYGGLFALIVIHLATLHKFRKHHAPPAPPSSVLKEDDQ